MQIAVIGAGLSGLSCARVLQAKGHRVTVYEKSHAVSGRMSTRRNELGGFDHGAQYFTATSAAFRQQATAWEKTGWVAAWNPRLAVLTHGRASDPSAAARRKQRWVPQPGMRSLGEQLAGGMDVRTGQQVRRIERDGDTWLLAIQADTVPIEATAGPFDAVVLAVPADQAVPLLEVISPTFSQQAAQARLAPCWCLMLAFADSLGLSYDAAWVDQSRLGWIAQDASKPGRRSGEHWVAQATAAWSTEHLEDDPERAREKLLSAFHEATGSQVQPVFAAVHRWRYSQALAPLRADFLWDATQGIGACGDWFSAGLDGMGRIENAWASGNALARNIG